MSLNISAEKKQKGSSQPQPDAVIDPFRKSKLKESQIVVAEVCCSRHLYCMQEQQHQHADEDTSFSVNSELLVEVTPSDLSAEPLIQYQIKPEVDMLAQINIKKKEYESMLRKCEEDVLRQEREKKLRQISMEAKAALAKSKKTVHSPKNNWGHSIFAQEKPNQQQKKQKTEVAKQQKKQIVIKPIAERIKQYKEQQAKRDRDQRQRNERKHRQIDIQEQERIIKQNADKILQEMRLQKAKKEEERKVIEAKIRALQLKSMKKVQQAKKKPFEVGEDFNLGDSQYSTFSARANNRKIQKKKKKQKPKLPSKDQLINTNPASNFLRRSSRNSKKSEAKLIKTQQLLPQTKEVQQPVPQPQPIKGPFFIWNIPVQPQQLEKLQQNENKVFMNVERLNYKTGRTFREEANQYMAKKMEHKMAEQRQQAKTHDFMKEVETKKQQLLRTFDQPTTKLIQEHFWNQDEVFRPNVLQNFHFYAKTQPL